MCLETGLSDFKSFLKPKFNYNINQKELNMVTG
jgi:hypothetical protein